MNELFLIYQLEKNWYTEHSNDRTENLTQLCKDNSSSNVT